MVCHKTYYKYCVCVCVDGVCVCVHVVCVWVLWVYSVCVSVFCMCGCVLYTCNLYVCDWSVWIINLSVMSFLQLFPRAGTRWKRNCAAVAVWKGARIVRNNDSHCWRRFLSGVCAARGGHAGGSHGQLCCGCVVCMLLDFLWAVTMLITICFRQGLFTHRKHKFNKWQV